LGSRPVVATSIAIIEEKIIENVTLWKEKLKRKRKGKARNIFPPPLLFNKKSTNNPEMKLMQKRFNDVSVL